MIRYIDKGTARQHLIDRLMESALNNVGIRADVDAVFLDIAKNRLPVWIDELQTYDVQEVRHGHNLNSDTRSLFECSVCHWSCWDTLCGDTTTYNYCPNCGAKMDEVKE